MLDLDLGDALLKCSEKLRQLANSLPPCAQVDTSLRGHELWVTIYLKDERNAAWRFVYRLEPNQSSEYDRQRLAECWAVGMRKLGLDKPCDAPSVPPR